MTSKIPVAFLLLCQPLIILSTPYHNDFDWIKSNLDGFDTSVKIDSIKLVNSAVTTPPAPCGLGPIPLDKEINGTFTGQLGQVVWQVSVETKRFGTWRHSCGGVVITKQAVLTSASCVKGYNSGMIRLEAGIVDLPKGGFVKRRRRFTYPGAQKPGLAYTESVKIHPKFDKKTLANNLAILRLSMPFDFVKSDGNISNICMPDTSASKLQSKANALFVSGWGAGVDMNGEKKRKKLQVRQARLVNCPLGTSYNSNEFCVSQDSVEITSIGSATLDRCEGDVGGPVFTDNGNFGSKLLGVASRGSNCTNDDPFIFIDVYAYLQWIHEASKPYYG